MEYKYISLGNKATAFYDAATGLYIADKEIKKVHPGYLKGKRAMSALQGGHLVYRTKEEYEAKAPKSPKIEAPEKGAEKYAGLTDAQKKFMMAYDRGSTAKQIAEMFNKDQLAEFAEASNIEVEEEDTKLDIVNAIISVIEDEE